MTPPYAAPPQPPAGKPRPRARWFGVGVLLLVLAAASLAGGLFLALAPLAQEDAVVTVGQGPVMVEVPPGEERALFTEDGRQVSCTATDADGATVELRPVSSTTTVNEWTARERFDTGAGDVVLDCTASGNGTDARVRIGEVPSGDRIAAGLVLAIGGSTVLGLAGLVVLVVTGVLWLTRPARP
ncbi:hypothetical protein [Nocardioides litoris]|uniref:hypothetical protein n=1 Tax=Nocardioides litoris TaxID=1926648 RepID=UPI00112413A8|nr:hypothetical protein [Nocardioides litoris]